MKLVLYCNVNTHLHEMQTLLDRFVQGTVPEIVVAQANRCA